MDGTTVPIKAATPDDARAQARQLQARIAAGEAVGGWDMGRVAGLAGRASVEGLVEGAGTLASLPADALYNVGVAATKGLDYLAGTDTGAEFGMPVTNRVSRAADMAADALSLPEPRTDNERLAMSIGKGAISAIPGMGLGAAMSAGGGAVRTAGNWMRAAPVTQMASGGAAGGASELAMQQTGSPTIAALAGLAGGVGTGVSMAAGQGALTALRPLTAGGRDRIVGDVLNMQARNPQRAIRNMTTAPTYVPGSRPLAGVASGDPGLINLQRGVERMDTRRLFAENIEQANQARNDALAAVTMNPSQVDALSKARTAKADIDTAALFDTPQMRAARVPTNNLMAQLHGLRQDRRLYARQPFQEAVREARRMIVNNSKRNRTTGEMEINPGVLYSIRQNLAQGLSGQIKSDAAPNVKLAGKAGEKILSIIDDEIEAAAPGFKAYMADLAQSGEARKQGALGYEAYQAGMSSGPTAVNGGAPFLNLASLRRAYQQRAPELSQTQRQTFEAVIKDLDRSMKTTAPSIRSSGSDTMQNLSVASFLGRALGGTVAEGPVGTAFAKPLNWLIGLGDLGAPATQERLVEAFADPAIAAALMRKATPGNIEFANSLLNKVLQGSRTAGQSAAAAQQGWAVEDAQGNRYDVNGNLVQ
jgi:hypothetical protein